MTDEKRNEELERARRIVEMTNDCHVLISKLYEGLVDREFVSAEKNARVLIAEIRLIIKSIPDDVF